MKKLALALVCIVSVAFFASCDPTITNPEPTIAILSDEGCLVGGEVIDMNVVYPYGFIATSNPQPMKELSKFVIVCGSTTLCDTAISGTVFNYKGEFYFSDEDSREIIGSAEIVATVTDVAGNTASATIKVDINGANCRTDYNVGLFSVIEGGASIKDLNVDGVVAGADLVIVRQLHHLVVEVVVTGTIVVMVKILVGNVE